VFENIVPWDYNSMQFPQQVYVGIDFNGDGHRAVGIVMNATDIYIIHEKNWPFITPTQEIVNYYTKQGHSVEIESGGYNEAFSTGIGDCSKLPFTEATKAQRLRALLKRQIHVDTKQTPLTLKDLHKTAWERDGKMQKRDDMHLVDALLHAAHEAQTLHFIEANANKGYNMEQKIRARFE